MMKAVQSAGTETHQLLGTVWKLLETMGGVKQDIGESDEEVNNIFNEKLLEDQDHLTELSLRCKDYVQKAQSYIDSCQSYGDDEFRTQIDQANGVISKWEKLQENMDKFKSDIEAKLNEYQQDLPSQINEFANRRPDSEFSREIKDQLSLMDDHRILVAIAFKDQTQHIQDLLGLLKADELPNNLDAMPDLINQIPQFITAARQDVDRADGYLNQSMANFQDVSELRSG